MHGCGSHEVGGHASQNGLAAAACRLLTNLLAWCCHARQVLRLERLQHARLWQGYCLYREELLDQCGGAAGEGRHAMRLACWAADGAGLNATYTLKRVRGTRSTLQLCCCLLRDWFQAGSPQ